MFKKLAIASVLGTAMLAGPGFAGTASSTFSVSVTLTPVCKVTATDGAIALNYTAFQTEAAKDDAEFSVSCTTGQSYSVGVDKHQTSYTDGATGLEYSLNLGTAGSTSGTNASLTGQTGNKSFYVTGTIASGLAGNTTGSSTTNQHTLVVTY